MFWCAKTAELPKQLGRQLSATVMRLGSKGAHRREQCSKWVMDAASECAKMGCHLTQKFKVSVLKL